MSNHHYATLISRSTREIRPQRSCYTTSNDTQAEWNHLRRQRSQYAASSGPYSITSSDRYRSGSVVSPIDPRQHCGRNSPVSPLSSRRPTPGNSARRPSTRPRRPGYDGVAFAQASGGLDDRYFTSSRRPDSSDHRAQSSSTSRGLSYTGSGYGRYASLNAGAALLSRSNADNSSSRYASTAYDGAASARYSSERHYTSGQQYGGCAPSSSTYQSRSIGRVYTPHGWQ